jgi:hypothetical protein
VPRKKNYDSAAKTLRIQFAKSLSEADYGNLIARLVSSSGTPAVELQTA